MRSDRLTVRAILLSLALLGGHRVAEASVTVPAEVERALLDVARKELAQDALAAGAESTRSGGNEDASHSDGRKDAVHAGGSEEPVGSVALSVEGEAISLSSSQRAELAKILDREVGESLRRYAVIRNGTEILLLGYLDTHRVRTVSESLCIVLTPSGEVRDVLVLAFAEPPEYQPAPVWYAQFRGLEPESRLKYGREIDAVTGATLTGRATVDAVARVRKIHRWLLEQEARP